MPRVSEMQEEQERYRTLLCLKDTLRKFNKLNNNTIKPRERENKNVKLN